MVAVLAVIHAAIAPASIPAIALSGFVGAIVYSACYLALTATASERALARRIIAFGIRAFAR
jgi:hypothetical protein